jgi:hypothetical protein
MRESDDLAVCGRFDEMRTAAAQSFTDVAFCGFGIGFAFVKDAVGVEEAGDRFAIGRAIGRVGRRDGGLGGVHG